MQVCGSTYVLGSMSAAASCLDRGLSGHARRIADGTDGWKANLAELSFAYMPGKVI